MGSCRVEIKRSAEKEIERLPQAIRRLAVKRILPLADDPRPPGSQRLAGGDEHRVRQGADRIVCTTGDAVVTVVVVRVAHRSDVQR